MQTDRVADVLIQGTRYGRPQLHPSVREHEAILEGRRVGNERHEWKTFDLAGRGSRLLLARSLANWVVCLAAVLSTACSTLPTVVEREPSTAFSAGKETALGRMFENQVQQHPGSSGVQLLNTGREALKVRVALLEVAERAVDLQYYIWNSDYSGRLLAERVLEAAERGVYVRLLLDDFNIGDRDPMLFSMDAHPNVEVRIYNPNVNRQGLAKWLTFVGEFGRLNQRMHNKLLVVDGSAAIVGGRNVGDEYFDLSETFNFRDRELLTVGPVVGEISAGFDAYWNSERSYPIDIIDPNGADPVEVQNMRSTLRDYLRTHPHPDHPMPVGRTAASATLAPWWADLIWAPATAVFDEVRAPDDIDGNSEKRVARTLEKLAEQVESEFMIESAYLILGDPGLVVVEALTGRGVSVRALTNSLASNDLTTNHAGYARRRRKMLESGMELFEFRPDAAACLRLIGDPSRCDQDTLIGLHAKSMVFDREVVFVGSFNLNLRSVFLNSETGLIVYSPELADRIASDIEQDMQPQNSWRVALDSNNRLTWVGLDDGVEVRYTVEPETGFWRRFKSGLFSLLPVEKYL